MEIIKTCLIGPITPEKIKKFTEYTVKRKDYHAYKWTWCGRYSVPFGLLTSYHLSKLLDRNPEGTLLGYASSIDHAHLRVDDLRMGTTAPANIHHWVGYVAVGYK